MILRKSIVTFLMICSIVLASCNNQSQQNTTASKIDASNETLHYLEDDGIRIILPKDYERYSSARFESLLNTITKGKAFEVEKKRLKHLRSVEGNNYIYFDSISKSTITINSIPHKPILREDAKTLLSDIARDQNEIAKEIGLKFTKVTANYNEGVRFQIFKAVYKATDTKNKTERFIHNYYISSKDKSLVINLSTPLDMNFDTYLQKMIF